MPLPIDDLNEILQEIYPRQRLCNSLTVEQAHRLGVLCMIFLLGTFMDVKKDSAAAAASDAEVFHQLARAALTIDPLTEHLTIPGVQALVLMIWYLRLYPTGKSARYQWGLSGYLAKFIQALGLHRNCRDPTVYTQNPTISLKFEQTFWEYQVMDIWQSLMFNQPTSMTDDIILCQTPSTVHVHAGLNPEFFVWKYSFARLVSKVVTITNGSNVIYRDILACEKDLLEHYSPPSLEWPTEHVAAHEPSGMVLERCISWIWKELAMLYIHRPYFWIAISRNAEEPYKDEYWYSIVIAYKSAVTLISHVRYLWDNFPRIIERWSMVWTHAQSAFHVLAALVLNSPTCIFASEALRRVEDTYNLIAEARASYQPPEILVSMQNLWVRATQTYKKCHPDTNGQEQASEMHRTSPPSPIMDSL